MDFEGGGRIDGKGGGCVWRLEGIRAKVTYGAEMVSKQLGPANTAGD